MVAFTTTLTTVTQAMERRVIERTETLEARMPAKIAAVTQQHVSYEARLIKLETQIEAMMDLLRKTASEQAEATQSWANDAGKAAAPPASFPSFNGSFLSPHSSFSHCCDSSQPMIVLDCSNAPDRSNDVVQLKAATDGTLANHEATKHVRCTGVQRRGGAEHRVKCIFESEEHAQLVRAHPAWLQAPRFADAHMLMEW